PISSYLDVVPVLEYPGARQALDPIGDIQAQVLEPEGGRAHSTRMRVAPGRDPFPGDARMGAAERPQQRRPVEAVAPRGARFEPIHRLGEDLLRRGELALQPLRRPRPAVVEHAGAGGARADPS